MNISQTPDFLGDVSSHFQVSPSGGWLQPPQVEGWSLGGRMRTIMVDDG